MDVPMRLKSWNTFTISFPFLSPILTIEKETLTYCQANVALQQALQQSRYFSDHVSWDHFHMVLWVIEALVFTLCSLSPQNERRPLLMCFSAAASWLQSLSEYSLCMKYESPQSTLPCCYRNTNIQYRTDKVVWADTLLIFSGNVYANLWWMHSLPWQEIHFRQIIGFHVLKELSLHPPIQEFAENLLNSGVHGAVMVLDPTFNTDAMAAALGIPSSKHMVRRHLVEEMKALIDSARWEEAFTKRSQERPPVVPGTFQNMSCFFSVNAVQMCILHLKLSQTLALPLMFPAGLMPSRTVSD